MPLIYVDLQGYMKYNYDNCRTRKIRLNKWFVCEWNPARCAYLAAGTAEFGKCWRKNGNSLKTNTKTG